MRKREEEPRKAGRGEYRDLISPEERGYKEPCISASAMSHLGHRGGRVLTPALALPASFPIPTDRARRVPSGRR